MHKFSLITLLFSHLYCTLLYADDTQVGHILQVKQLVVASTGGATPRVLGKDSAVYRNDQIQTGDKSFAVIRLNDGSTLTLRANTTFKIRQFSIKKGQEKIHIELIKGSVKALTGFISKLGGNRAVLTTPNATIGIRGTKFIAVQCDQRCVTTAKQQPGKRVLAQPKAVARVLLAKGQISAQNKVDKTRELVKGSPVYPHDVIVTTKRAFAILQFSDNSRITIRSNSRFAIQDYHFKRTDATQDSSTLQLINGGIRVLTGELGKRTPSAYQVNTPDATIGIRGTGFDVLSAPTRVHVWQGQIRLQNQHHTLQVNPQQSVAINTAGVITRLSTRPAAFNSLAPRPDSAQIEQLARRTDFFSQHTQDITQFGLYVYVQAGDVKVHSVDNTVYIGAGEIAFVHRDSAKNTRVDNAPAHILGDDVSTTNADTKNADNTGPNALLPDAAMCEVK